MFKELQEDFQRLVTADPLLEMHYQEYINVLSKLTNTSIEDAMPGLKMLKGHTKRLIRTVNRYQREIGKLRTENPFEVDGAIEQISVTIHNDALLEILKKNIFEIIGHTQDAIHQLKEYEGQVAKVLIAPSQDALFFLGAINDLAQTENPNTKMADKNYQIWDNQMIREFCFVDGIFEQGADYFLNGKNLLDQEVRQQFMPEEVNRSKFSFILAFANAKHDFGLNEQEIKFFGIALAALSKHPRGITSPHMPTECKLRHNPAIHSINVAILGSKLFDATIEQIKSADMDKAAESTILAKLQEHKRLVVWAAFSHDLGEELLKELSVGSTVAAMNADQRAGFNDQRNELEEYAVRKTIEEVGSRCEKYYDIEPEQIEDISTKLMEGFNLAENTKCFLGRFVKTAERMHSSYDYIKWQSIGNATPLKDVGDREKDFSLNYVLNVLYGAKFPETPSSLDVLRFDDLSLEEAHAMSDEADKHREDVIKEIKIGSVRPDGTGKTLAQLAAASKDSIDTKIFSELAKAAESNFTFIWEEFGKGFDIDKATMQEGLKRLRN